LIEKLKESKINIIALEQSKKSILYTKFKPKFPLALIVGNEVSGISKNILEKCDKIIELPMQGKKESLNVSVSFGIAGYKIKYN
jgi:tRNA G18 (ribose-2'-O)-methylase SpoU